MNPNCPKCGKLINDLRSSKVEAVDMYGKEEKIPMVVYACTNGCNTIVGVTVDPTWLVNQVAKRVG